MSFSEDNDTNLALLERELTSLCPLPPDPDFCRRLERRMEKALGTPAAKAAATLEKQENTVVAFPQPVAVPQARKPWRRRNIAWATAAAVTASVGTHLANRTGPAATSAANQIVAAPAPSKHDQINEVIRVRNSARNLQKVSQDSIRIDPTRGPVQQIQFQFMNDYQFETPSGQRLEYHYPSQEKLTIPIDFY